VESCSSCGQGLGIPIDRGELSLTCPTCRESWEWKSPLKSCLHCKHSGALMSKFPEKIQVFRFRQSFDVIADSLEQARQTLLDAQVPHIAHDSPAMEELPNRHILPPLVIQDGYSLIFEESSYHLSQFDESHVENINKLVDYFRPVFDRQSTFPVVPQLELAPPELVVFLVDLVQEIRPVSENHRSYYFLRYPSLPSMIYQWNRSGGFSLQNR
jgi:hypothetical protein